MKDNRGPIIPGVVYLDPHNDNDTVRKCLYPHPLTVFAVRGTVIAYAALAPDSMAYQILTTMEED